jgi:hypothetical protein
MNVNRSTFSYVHPQDEQKLFQAKSLLVIIDHVSQVERKPGLSLPIIDRH